MRLQLSRNTKNRILICVNVLIALITIAKLIVEPESVSRHMRVWLAVSPIVLVLSSVPAGAAFAKIAHAGLFLLTGAAIGITLRTAISGAPPIWLVELAWLVLAIIAAILHYSPSVEDEYLR